MKLTDEIIKTSIYQEVKEFFDNSNEEVKEKLQWEGCTYSTNEIKAANGFLKYKNLLVGDKCRIDFHVRCVRTSDTRYISGVSYWWGSDCMNNYIILQFTEGRNWYNPYVTSILLTELPRLIEFLDSLMVKYNVSEPESIHDKLKNLIDVRKIYTEVTNTVIIKGFDINNKKEVKFPAHYWEIEGLDIPWE